MFPNQSHLLNLSTATGMSEMAADTCQTTQHVMLRRSNYIKILSGKNRLTDSEGVGGRAEEDERGEDGGGVGKAHIVTTGYSSCSVSRTRNFTKQNQVCFCMPDYPVSILNLYKQPSPGLAFLISSNSVWPVVSELESQRESQRRTQDPQRGQWWWLRDLARLINTRSYINNCPSVTPAHNGQCSSLTDWHSITASSPEQPSDEASCLP